MTSGLYASVGFLYLPFNTREIHSCRLLCDCINMDGVLVVSEWSSSIRNYNICPLIKLKENKENEPL